MFMQRKFYKDIFSGDLDVATLLLKCPQARTALNFFSIDKRYDVIESSSLLGLNYKDVSSYPVDYVLR